MLQEILGHASITTTLDRYPGEMDRCVDRLNSAYQPLTRVDRLSAQPAGGLLGPPALQHRLDHRLLQPQMDDPSISCPLAAPAKPIRRNPGPP